VVRDNAQCGIADRKYLPNVSKGQKLDADKLARVTESYAAFSLRLQTAFGLRREESIKLRAAWADRGNGTSRNRNRSKLLRFTSGGSRAAL